MFGLFGRKPRENVISPPMDAREAALQSIVPLVRSTGGSPDPVVLEALAEQHLAPVSRPFVADLFVVYSDVKESGSGLISQQRMEALGLSADELHELAIRNLPDHVKRIRLEGMLPRFMLSCSGNLEASLLLYDKLWSDLADSLPGNPMAAVPAHGQLFVTGSEWGSAYQHLSEVVSRKLEPEKVALSRHVLLRRDGAWVAVRRAG